MKPPVAGTVLGTPGIFFCVKVSISSALTGVCVCVSESESVSLPSASSLTFLFPPLPACPALYSVS